MILIRTIAAAVVAVAQALLLDAHALAVTDDNSITIGDDVPLDSSDLRWEGLSSCASRAQRSWCPSGTLCGECPPTLLTAFLLVTSWPWNDKPA